MKKRFLFVLAFVALLLSAIFAGCGGGNNEKYDITVEGGQGGRIELSASEASEGETVTVICIPDDGFKLKEGSLKANGESLEGFTFVMPAGPVTVTAEFVSDGGSED